jgi:hypothetical protein
MSARQFGDPRFGQLQHFVGLGGIPRIVEFIVQQRQFDGFQQHLRIGRERLRFNFLQ